MTPSLRAHIWLVGYANVCVLDAPVLYHNTKHFGKCRTEAIKGNKFRPRVYKYTCSLVSYILFRLSLLNQRARGHATGAPFCNLNKLFCWD